MTLRLSHVLSSTSAVLLVGLTALATAAPAAAQGPVIERGSVHDTFVDDLYLDLCGTRTKTTVSERWTLKTYPDGSQVFHDVRTFRSADPRRLDLVQPGRRSIEG